MKWLERLRIICKIGEIVFRGHSLPETVMHRDLKPSNIIIRNFEFDFAVDPDVLVLDFDMSWHKGANEKDVVFESRDDFGYLAPEQTTWMKHVSAVSTRVDSYGLGMTAYFAFGGIHPRPNEGLAERWRETALRATKLGYDGTWRSAPFRLARLIQECTEIEQINRLDFSIALRDFSAVRDAVIQPTAMKNPELWAEEVIANLPSASTYVWDRDKLTATVTLERGIRIRSSADVNSKSVRLEFDFANQGGQQYTKLTQRIDALPNNITKIFAEGGWKVDECRKGMYQLSITASIKVVNIVDNIAKTIRCAVLAYKAFETLGGVW